MRDVHTERGRPTRKPPSLYHRETGVCTLGQAVQHHIYASQMVRGGTPGLEAEPDALSELNKLWVIFKD